MLQAAFREMCSASINTVVGEVIGNKTGSTDATVPERIFKASVADLFRTFNMLARIGEVRDLIA